MTLNIGDRLWLESNTYGHGGGYVTVTKIGRKWVTLSNGDRFDPSKTPWRTDGEGYSQQSHPVWLCREDAVEAARLSRSIEVLRRIVDWRYVIDLRTRVTNFDQVRRACETLGLLPEFDAMMEKKP